jgi:predicted transcriptional regulator
MSKELMELEANFRECWDHLNESQKRSVFEIAKEISIQPDEDFLKQYNDDIDLAIKEIEAGHYFTHKEVLKMVAEDGK